MAEKQEQRTGYRTRIVGHYEAVESAIDMARDPNRRWYDGDELWLWPNDPRFGRPTYQAKVTIHLAHRGNAASRNPSKF